MAYARHHDGRRGLRVALRPSFSWFRRRKMSLLECCFLLRVRSPLVYQPHGDDDGRPPDDLPSPPPIGWSTAFIATPRTFGRRPIHREAPAFPSTRCCQLGLLTSPIVAVHVRSTFRISPDCSLSSAYFSSFDWSFADVPAARIILPPQPGRISMLWTIVPSGMNWSGIALPGEKGAPSPHCSTLPSSSPSGARMYEGAPSLTFVRVRNELPPWLPKEEVPATVLGFPVDYRYMIRWKAGLMWEMPELGGYEYVWMLDTDAFILGPISYDPFAVMAAANATYGYIDVNVETPEVAGGLADCVEEYLADHPRVRPTLLRRYKKGGKWDGSKFYTNFQLMRVAYGRSAAYQAWFEHVDRSREPAQLGRTHCQRALRQAPRAASA